MRPAPLIAVAVAATAAGLFFAAQMRPPRALAELAPSGALLYLESADFAGELAQWDASTTKREWLASANYSEFARSHLFLRLAGEWGEFGSVAGFRADLPILRSIAGKRAALALYDIGNLHFLYVSEVPEAQSMQTVLWQTRARYEPRSVAGMDFYVRRDGSHTVAFAAVKNYLFLATREELVAGALRLLAGENTPTVASEAWFQQTTAAAKQPGELRLVMNLEDIYKTPHFRSHWIQRNTAELREFWAGISDLRRPAGQIREDRVLLRKTPLAPPSAAAPLARLAPDDAAFYRAWPVASPGEVVALLERKFIAAKPGPASRWEEGPEVAADITAGSEADLETRIDEPPLERHDEVGDEALRDLVTRAGVRTALLVQTSSVAPGGVFVRLPCAIVLESAQPWDDAALRNALTAAVANAWSTAGLGVNWVERRRSTAVWHQIDGLGAIAAATRGHLAVIGNSGDLVAAMLDRTSLNPAAPAATYVAEFRHHREQANFEQLTGMLDQIPATRYVDRSVLPFFSANLASLGRVLQRIRTASLTSTDTGSAVLQTRLYMF